MLNQDPQHQLIYFGLIVNVSCGLSGCMQLWLGRQMRCEACPAAAASLEGSSQLAHLCMAIGSGRTSAPPAAAFPCIHPPAGQRLEPGRL